MFSFSPFLSNCQLPQSTCLIKNTENNVDNNVNIGVLRPTIRGGDVNARKRNDLCDIHTDIYTYKHFTLNGLITGFLQVMPLNISFMIIMSSMMENWW